MLIEHGIAALAVMILTAWIVMRDAQPAPPREPRRRRGPKHRRSRRRPRAAPAADPWIAHPEPLTVEDRVELVGGATAGRPVLAYIEEPRRSPDPDRLIQTEVLLPSGTEARVLALVRLLLTVIAFGLLLGSAIVGSVRGLAWFLRLLTGA